MTHDDGVLKACRLLGLHADRDYVVDLGDGRAVHSIARIREMGARNGMLVFTNWSDVGIHSGSLVEAGYAYSCFDPPMGNSTFDLDSFKAVFRDWGWAGRPSGEPDWF